MYVCALCTYVIFACLDVILLKNTAEATATKQTT